MLYCPTSILPLLASLLLASPDLSDPADSPALVALTVEVTDLRNRKGHLRLGVFDSARGFPRQREGALAWHTLPANTEETVFHIELPPGEYAVVVLHDENGNKKLDMNIVGVPKEGYGVSNNPKPKYRAARFDEAAFTLPGEGKALTVSIQYF